MEPTRESNFQVIGGVKSFLVASVEPTLLPDFPVTCVYANLDWANLAYYK